MEKMQVDLKHSNGKKKKENESKNKKWKRKKEDKKILPREIKKEILRRSGFLKAII